MPEESKSWPFSSYDFFGYLMPGLIFSLSLYGWLLYAKFEFVSKIHYSRVIGLKLGDSIIVFFIAIVICYFLGHLIGAVSHILYDRMLIRNCIGYPFHYLLETGHPPKASTRILYLNAIIVLMLLLIIPGCFEMYYSFWNSDFFLSHFSESAKSIPAQEWGAFWARIAFFVLFIILIVLLDIRMYSMKNEYRHIHQRKDQASQKPDGKIASFVKENFFVPIRQFTATDSFLNKKICEDFHKKMKSEYGISSKSENSDVFWLASMSLLKKNKIDSRLTNWLNLYGCLRNYSCAFLILAVIIVSNHWYHVLWLNEITGLKGSRILLASLIISFILFLRYWVIYYSYYSKYIIRAYACSQLDQNDDKKGDDSFYDRIISFFRFHL